MKLIEIPLFRFNFYLLVEKDKVKIKKALVKYLNDWNAQDKHGLIDRYSDYPGYCVFFAKPVPPVMYLQSVKNLADVVHECSHMAIEICESRGIPITKGNDETFAYIMGYLIEQIVKK